jgi:hypothetical protein
MFKAIIISFIIVVLLAFYAHAQIPGDVNCSGSFNGLDIQYLAAHVAGSYQSNWFDTLSCSWLGGDMNGDSLYHTVADWWNILHFFDFIGNNPPHPDELDTLVISEVYTSPGDTAGLPIYVITPDSLTGVNVHFTFNNALSEFLYIDYAGVFSIEHYYQYQGGVISFQLVDEDPVPSGHYFIGEIVFVVSSDIPPGTDIIIDLYEDWYYPSGFGNYSIPTYFIQPVLIDGIIHVVTTGVGETNLPELQKIHLSNYPNPFNASTVIEFELLNDSPIELTIYDLLGREIDSPVSTHLNSGHYEIYWNGSNHPSGIYFYRLETADGSYTRRMTLLK